MRLLLPKVKGTLLLSFAASIGIRLLFRIIRFIPARIAGAIGAGLGRMLFPVLKKHRDIALTNLQRIYPHKNDAWRYHMARESFAELGRSVMELPHVFLRCKAALLSKIDIEGEDMLRRAMTEGNGVFIAGCHIGNWELAGIILSILGYPVHTIYRPLKQRAIDTYLKSLRERFGTTMHSRLGDGIRWLPSAIKQGDAVLVVVDQNMSQGIHVPFLGHLSSTTALPAPFIMKKNTPTFGIAIERVGKRFQFKIKLWPITPPALTGDKEQDQIAIMDRICASFDPIIHAHPEQWLWIHRRWLILDEGLVNEPNKNNATEATHGAS